MQRFQMASRGSPKAACSRPALVLERTAFYPTSGGQPYDTGTLAGVDIQLRAGNTLIVRVAAGQSQAGALAESGTTTRA